ncbi:hypothetical protein M9194_20745 [Vibrio sp. S4M6]|uniref:WD40 repeat domain-containing protein n=1 Tax=Vibrio sinus TaxID=2946865 RepID=UPI00202AB349|nr:hypothetical protein [Vibrio sinus]MCL9783854.1 hypothetical protein [Vibrio sinus]
MRHIFHAILPIIVIVLLNGCFFSTDDDQKWVLEPDGSTAFALSRDGRFALVYSLENHLVLWDLYQDKKLANLGEQDPQAHTVSTIRISDNGRYAVTATQTNFAVWDLAWTQAEGLWSIDDALIVDADVSSNGKQVLLALTNGKAIYVNLETGRRLEFLAHQDKVNTVAISPNGKYALSGGNDHFAYLWDTQNGQVIREFRHKQRVNRVALQRDGKYALTSDVGNDAIIWDLKTGDKISHLHSFSRQLIFSTARFSDSGRLLVTGTPSSRIIVWESQSGDKIDGFETTPKKDTRPPRAVVYDAAFDHKNRVISGTSAGIAQAWKLDD